jgi:hypothetical protein
MKRKALQRMIEKDFDGDGRVKYDQRNPLAVAVVAAGDAARDVGYSRNRPNDERSVVEAAEEKRQRKAQKRMRNAMGANNE